MVDPAKLFQHWLSDADDSWVDAESLLEKKRYAFAAFATHLAIEKTLKAYVARATQDIPPRTHNLVRLAELAELPISEEQRNFLYELNAYQLEGRYKDVPRAPVQPSDVLRDHKRAKEFDKWVRNH